MSGQARDEAAPVVAPGQVEMNGRPLVLLDFDGVLSVPFGRTPEMKADGWRYGMAVLDGGPERVLLNPAHGRWLLDLAAETGAELAWATMRERVANSRLSPMLGLPSLPVAPALSSWSKASSVVPWTAGRPFTWFEDLWDECDEAGELAGNQPHLMVRVDPQRGLARDHIALAREWLLGLRA